jgi:hypothetical protein
MQSLPYGFTNYGTFTNSYSQHELCSSQLLHGAIPPTKFGLILPFLSPTTYVFDNWFGKKELQVCLK